MEKEATKLHDIELIDSMSNDKGRYSFSRIQVKGGWIYLHESQSFALGNIATSMVFVPDNYDMEPKHGLLQ